MELALSIYAFVDFNLETPLFVEEGAPFGSP